MSEVIDLIRSTAARYGVPENIALSVATIESSLNQDARGAAGEVGVFQLMPGTAKELGVNAAILAENIDGGIRYLSQQFARFGTWDQALAAYNAGASRVVAGNIPTSTQAYVRKVLGEIGTFTSIGIPTFSIDVFGKTEADFPLWVLAIGIGAGLYFLMGNRKRKTVA